MQPYPNEQIAVSAADVVVDTCVLLDILFAERPRHAVAHRLPAALTSSGARAFIPAHAYFELVSAIAAERRRGGAPLTLVGSGTNLLPMETAIVSIDLNFVNDYLTRSLASGQLIDTSGADMIFVAVALKHGLSLISEDEPLRKRAQALGVTAIDAATYIAGAPTKS